jgi:hypothetical protein
MGQNDSETGNVGRRKNGQSRWPIPQRYTLPQIGYRQFQARR